MVDRSEAPALLLVSLLAAREEPRQAALEALVRAWGPLVFLSRPLAFEGQAYYQEEMGWPLTRRLAAFQELLPPWRLGQAKRLCQEVEAQLSDAQGQRQVNLDPGYLSAGALVLASGKPQGHRLPLREGLWAEITLWFHHGGFHPLPWTYPDYAGLEMRRPLLGLRRRYLWQLKQRQARGGTP